MIAYSSDATQICSDELTQGDIIRYFTGETSQVIGKPEYICCGINFKVLCLGVETLLNTQTVVFAVKWRFESIDHQPLGAL